MSKLLYFKSVFTLVCFTLCGTLFAQTAEEIEKLNGRIGINTTVPRATLDIHKKDPSELVAGVAQGVIFPRFTTEERGKFDYDQLTDGLLIYNLSKKCVELCYDFKGKLIWRCLAKKDPLSYDIVQEIDDDPLIKKQFSLSVSGFHGNIYDPIPNISWPKRIVKKAVTIGAQTETLILTIPAGNVEYGSIYIPDVEIETESGNPLNLSTLSTNEVFAKFEVFLDDDNEVFLNVQLLKL